ncbi:hypothetical protein [Streptomyces sp. NPDC018584]|uniref:hypothetical protein n=1 Tax=unclassified Streptomyces TaxID=2593676 RepID=UPI00379C7F79
MVAPAQVDMASGFLNTVRGGTGAVMLTVLGALLLALLESRVGSAELAGRITAGAGGHAGAVHRGVADRPVVRGGPQHRHRAPRPRPAAPPHTYGEDHRHRPGPGPHPLTDRPITTHRTPALEEYAMSTTPHPTTTPLRLAVILGSTRDGRAHEQDGAAGAAKVMLDQLAWWAKALRTARTENPYR